jgi:dihydroorotase
MKYDIVLRNAHVIDPSQSIDGRCDVAVLGGRVAAIGNDLHADPATPEEDLGGFYLTPGLVDLHGHWYEGSAFGIDPHYCLRHGVTTAVDAGTTGFINFEEFRRHGIEGGRIRVLAFLNIAAGGIPTPMAGELMDLRMARPHEAAETVLAHPDVLLGVKVRIGTMSGSHGVAVLDRALEAAEACKLRVMVHISKSAPTREILNKLRPGDILTHCFQGRGDGLLEQGRVIPEAAAARERGVIFDVGHGCGSFSWETAKRAFEHLFYPDTISTDLHRYSIERSCIDMPTTMSKFLHLGMPLPDIILKTTWRAACAIGRARDIGTLRPGAHADVFVLSLEEGEFPLQDTHGRTITAKRRIAPHKVMRAGGWDTGEGIRRLRPLRECDYEVFRNLEESA